MPEHARPYKSRVRAERSGLFWGEMTIDYVRSGTTGTDVSSICLGHMTFDDTTQVHAGDASVAASQSVCGFEPIAQENEIIAARTVNLICACEIAAHFQRAVMSSGKLTCCAEIM